MHIDLHTHSTASDGTCSPSEIVELAIEKKLAAVALTDHDTISGIPEFLEAGGKGNGVSLVPGVEVSVDYKNLSIHILGLFVDAGSAPLGDFLRGIRVERDGRNFQVAEKLRGLGYDITLEEVLSVAGGESVGRPHFARILMDKGYFDNRQDVFDKLLKNGKKAFVKRKLPSPADTISIIHSAGGLAFWAHPFSRNVDANIPALRKVLKSLMRKGLDGIEAYYSTFTDVQRDMLLGIASELNILVCGGSDFHGENMTGIELGAGEGNLSVPVSVLEKIEESRKNGKIHGKAF